MFQFPTSPSVMLCIYITVPGFLAQVGCPIRISTGLWLFAPLRSFSQLTTSFFVFWCLGIHPMLLIAWPSDSLYASYYCVRLRILRYSCIFYTLHSSILVFLVLLASIDSVRTCNLKSLVLVLFKVFVFYHRLNDNPKSHLYFVCTRYPFMSSHLSLYLYYIVFKVQFKFRY